MMLAPDGEPAGVPSVRRVAISLRSSLPPTEALPTYSTPDLGGPAAAEIEGLGHRLRHVHQPVGVVGPAIVDPHHHRVAVLEVVTRA